MESMKAFFITLLLVALAQTQHVDEDKQVLILAGKIQDLQTANVENVTVPESDKKNGSIKKLKEFEDHAELKAQTEQPEETPTPVTPIPKAVSRESSETDGRKPLNITTQQGSNLHPVPKQVHPDGVEDSLIDDGLDSKPSVPKKGADPKDEKLSVPKKGADPNDEKQSVPKKGADPKDEKQSVAKKGADPKDENKSAAKTGVDPKDDAQSLQVESVVGNGDIDLTTTVPSDEAGQDDERKSVPRKGADPSIFSETSITVGYSVTDSPGISINEKTEVSNKTKMDIDMSTPSSNKKFTSTVNEASMDFSESFTKPFIEVQSSQTSSVLLSTESKMSVPNKTLIVNITTTEGYPTTNFKPTAATDTKGDGGSTDEENISYTPAVVGVVLLVVIFITVIVIGYRRLQDVWMRRHYARMDFLIDGMYDV